MSFSARDGAPPPAPAHNGGRGPTITALLTSANQPAQPELGRVEVTKVVTGDAPADAEFQICLTGPLPDDPDKCQTLTSS